MPSMSARAAESPMRNIGWSSTMSTRSTARSPDFIDPRSRPLGPFARRARSSISALGRSGHSLAVLAHRSRLREEDVESGAVRCAGADRDRAAQLGGALAHRGQADADRRAGGKADAVVHDLDLDDVARLYA